ncbi:sulfite exporter TauE/SafE family protein [Piscinibacter sp. XHJ-5]|uniref:sulfite exporter TauE/SafE family protein n=1 Tax=Piscinibacter sp. XHJ-5 TaxID=3037797 RepID=UPI00245363E4|nr:sulfite exporter TauE/SafE family protein [Piscinibacter sp. XHJ-5]
MSNLPLIDDPAFYALAVPAVLLMGLAKSGFLGGFGSLATPLLALVVPVPQAAAIMLPLLLVMDATGLQQLWRDRDSALLRLLLPAGLIGTVVGTVLFGVLSTKTVAGLVGGLTLLFLAQRLVFPPRADAPPPPRALGFVLGIASGFTSFVAHAGSPPISAYVLPLRLPPVTFAATMAVFFGAVNLSKWIPYAWLGLIDMRNLSTSLVLLPLAPVGVWLGVWLTRRIASAWFYRLAYAGMFLTGAKLLWDGLK